MQNNHKIVFDASESLSSTKKRDLIRKDTQERLKEFQESHQSSDLEFARQMYLELISDSKEGVELAKEAALNNDHPRQIESLYGMIKTASECVDSLVKLHEAGNKLIGNKDTAESSPQTINNNLVVGSTAELQKMLKEMKK